MNRRGNSATPRLFVALFATVLITSSVCGAVIAAGSASAINAVGSVGSRPGHAPIASNPHFTTTYPLYTAGQLYGGSNSGAVCYTCEAADITGTAPPSESLNDGSGVDSLTGDFSTTNDLFSSAPSVGLPMSLTYDAQLAQAEVPYSAYGEFGVGWSSNFDTSMTPQSGTNPTSSITINSANGAQSTFTESAGGGASYSCPSGDYPTTNKYTAATYGTESDYYQWCALASVKGQLFSYPNGPIVYEADGGQNQEIFNWDGSLGGVVSYSSNVGESSVYVTYDVAPLGLSYSPPCPTTATDCIDERSYGDDDSPNPTYLVEAQNASGLVTQVIDPSGITYDMSYNSSNDLTTIEDYANQTSPSTWNYAYDTTQASPNSSDLIKIEDPDYTSGSAHTVTVAYNNSGTDSGMVHTLTDGASAVTSYAYADPCQTGQCVATNAPQQTTVTYPTQVPSPGGTAVSPVEVDTYVGGVESSTSLGSSTNSYNNETWSYNWTMGYGSANSTEVITYPHSLGGTAATATIVLDPAGNVISTTNALGDVATSAYNDSGGNDLPELLWSYPGSSSNGPTNPPAGSWVYTYNTLGQVVTVTDPLGNKTTYGYYASDDDPCFVAQPTVSMSGYSSSCAGYGGTWSGDLGVQVTEAPQGSTAYIYDYYGNVATTDVDNDDNASNGGDPQTTTSSYNVMGDQLWSIPPAGQGGSQSSTNPYATVTTYSPANLPLTVTKPGQSTVTNAYDAALNLVSSSSSASATTTYYDGDNRACYQVVAGTVQSLTSCPTPATGTGKTTVLAGSTVTTYVPGSTTVASTTDGNGYTTWDYYGDLAYPSSPTEVVDSLGNEIQYTAYNDFGNACVSGDVSLASHQGTSSQCSTVSGDTTTVYNAIGDETSITDPNGNTTTNTYTNTAYPTLETSTENAQSATTSYTYDADGNEIKTTNPDGTFVYTDYDTDNRVCASDAGTNYGCDSNTGTYGVTDYVYNNASDPTTVTSSVFGGAVGISNNDVPGCTWGTGASGTVDCWGSSIGNGTNQPSPTPTAVGGLRNVSQVAGSCALLTNQTVKCWDTYVGDGTSNIPLAPEAVPGLTGVTQIAEAGQGACALLSSGTVDCWGANVWGQLGNGSNSTTLTPTPVSGLSGVTQISMSSNNTCAVTSGAVDCWGWDGEDQLGENGNGSYSYVPVSLYPALSGVTSVSASNNPCALLSNGTISCWGNGNPVPATVSGITTATQVSAGFWGADCALISGGTVECWGANEEGQLGNGTISSGSSTPVDVSNITNAVSVSNSCAVLSSGGVDCWGEGNGNPFDSVYDVPEPLVTATNNTYVNGQLTTTTDPNGQMLSYLYNYDGQVACTAYVIFTVANCGTISSPATASPTNTIEARTYDTSGRLSSITDWMTTNNTTTYTYGDANFPNAVTKITYPSSTGLTANYGYDADGNLTGLTAGSAISDTWTYNDDEQVSTTKINSSTSATVGYNANSQITAAANLGSSTTNDAYTIAANGEITKDVPPSGSTSYYSYNNGDELCNTNNASISCTTNPSTGTKFAYTTNGQRSTATPYTSGTAGSPTYYDWNALGELCNVATASTSCGTQPSSGTSYQYSGNGLRITASTSTTTTDSAWDTVSGGSIPLNVNDEATTSGTTTNTSYLYGNLLFGGTAPLEQITTTSSGATPVFLLPNPTGVQEVVSTAGADDELAVYSVYGKQTISSGSRVTPFGFQGSYTDSTGMIYLINRYYDPGTDQFLSIDPDIADTNQPYAFTNDDPLNAEDPLGQCGGFFHVFCSAADGVGHFVVQHSTGILQVVEVGGALACAFASAGTAAGVCFVAAASSFTTGVAVSVVQNYNPNTGSENYVMLGASVALDGLAAVGPPDTSQPLRAILGLTNAGIVLEHSVTTSTTSKKKKK